MNPTGKEKAHRMSYQLAMENVSSASSATSITTLDQAAIGDSFSVRRVEARPEAPEWARWLEEIGFIVGERVMLMARGLPGGDPLVVRVGQSTFALRRAEAACIHVDVLPATKGGAA